MTLSIVGVSQAQETGVFGSRGNKALKLVQKGDLRGAINIFTDILKDDPSQKDVLLMRAKTKFKAGAYQGTINDCFAYMEKHGIDDAVAGLLGKTQLAKGDYKQALAYLKVALLFNPTGEEYLLDRGQAYFDLGLDQEACNDWYDAAVAGSMEGKRLSEKYCRNFRKGNSKPKKDKPKNTNDDVVDNSSEDNSSTNEDTNNNTDTSSNTDSGNNTDTSSNDQDTADNTDQPKKDVPVNSGNTSNDQNDTTSSNNTNTNSNDNSDSGSDILVEDTSYENDYPIDTKINKIYIDEDLTIKIADGIGSREVKEMPDMLILSDYNGEVVVDVCINRIGKVVSSQLNESRSSIKTKSLVSLALRKSEEFWFDRTDRKEQCGTITFVIRAGNE